MNIRIRKITGFLSLAIILSVALSLFAPFAVSAQTSTTNRVLACLGAAVSTREVALGAGIAAHGQAITGAYGARAIALQQAYSGSSTAEVRTAIKTAWSNFNKSVRTANAAWKKTRDSAWSSFRTSLKDCGAPAAITDSLNSSLEI